MKLADMELAVRCRLGLDRLDSASQLCTLVFNCNLPLLRRLMAAGIDVDAGDYDDRTALHIAACGCNLAIVRSPPTIQRFNPVSHSSVCPQMTPFCVSPATWASPRVSYGTLVGVVQATCPTQMCRDTRCSQDLGPEP